MKELNKLIKSISEKNQSQSFSVSKVNSEVGKYPEAPIKPLVMIAHDQEGELY